MAALATTGLLSPATWQTTFDIEQQLPGRAVRSSLPAAL
jgi:hypothetical protein